MTIEFRVLKADEQHVLTKVAPEVFDYSVDIQLCKELLQDSRYHLAVATDQDIVVGSASAVNYIHPDKTVELWVNEMGTAPTHRNRGVAKALLALIFEEGRKFGCSSAWLLPERSNAPAMRLYRSYGGVEAIEDVVMYSFELER